MTKFWYEPQITLLARSRMEKATKEWDGQDDHGDFALSGDKIPEWAGRACYWSYGKGRKTNSEYLRHIIDAGHGSVLEHAHWTFGIKGISRSLSHELVRHRHFNFSQLSQRYVADEPEFVVPPGLSGDQVLDFTAACTAAARYWRVIKGALSDDKVGREAARAVLPNATATRIVVTGNTRALRHMLALRGSEGADAEFRRLATAWLKLMKELSPNAFFDMDVTNGYVTTGQPK